MIIPGSFIVKTRLPRFTLRKMKSKDSGSSVSLSDYKPQPTRSRLPPRDPPTQSHSLDVGKSRLAGLRFRKLMFRKKR